MSTIKSASRPYFYSDSLTLDYFSILMSLISHNTEAFMSHVGIEFIIHFMLNYRHSSGSAVGVGESVNTVAEKIQV